MVLAPSREIRRIVACFVIVVIKATEVDVYVPFRLEVERDFAGIAVSERSRIALAEPENLQRVRRVAKIFRQRELRSFIRRQNKERREEIARLIRVTNRSLINAPRPNSVRKFKRRRWKRAFYPPVFPNR